MSAKGYFTAPFALALACGATSVATAQQGNTAVALPGRSDDGRVAPTKPGESAASASATQPQGGDIIVTGSRLDLLGTAATASQGTITQKEVALRPIFRPGQLFESIPGLVVTIHSGEGKANQYLIRGYNLDHGTDFANFVDDMPVNRPTNTHGQGYSDLAFLIPQIVSSIDYTKGPYYAGIGDFGSVASSHTRLATDIPAQATLTAGTDGFQSLVASGTLHFSDDRHLLGALELAHFDGPWQPAQNFRKVNIVLRYSQGNGSDGVSLTGMFYKSAGLLTTDQPQRAIDQGLISRFGTLDPTDASRSLRYSLSAHLNKPVGPGQFAASLYGIHSTMTLWNDFTHFLYDPVNGDQEQQDESRSTFGGELAYTVYRNFGSIKTDIIVGLQGRYDSNFLDRRHTLRRMTLPSCTLVQPDGSTLTYPAVGASCSADRVHLLDLAPYVELTLRWTPWLRTILGLRGNITGPTTAAK